ncbi:MAG: hypothetical protein K2L73_04200, partial [Muribaculaceae bacterium]|nr:hypothetical protein [Muribaculaceae bacterium]
MMKKIFFCMALGATLLSSCSSDEPVITTDGGNVTFRATLPAGIMSRSAYDDGLTASNLEYAVYDATGANIVGLNGSATLVDRTATIGLNLVTGKTYTVVFWAAADGAPYTFDATEGKMTVTPAGDANDTKRDAFFASETFTVTGAVSKTIELRRPFAQINIGTSDLDDFTNAGGKISKSGITVTAAETLNLIDGTVEGEVEYVLAPAAHVTDVEYTVPSADKQQLLTTNFVLVDRAKSTLDITWTSDNDTPGRTEVVYTHVPVQRNYRTNIYGKLLTNPTSYEVVINPEFEDGDLNSDQDIDLPEIAPGVYNNVATKTYIVTTTEGFKWFAENKTLGKKETFQLGGNIDLGGEPITPIKTEWQSNAVVDGNGFTISNIKFDAAHAALFQGTTNSGSGWVGSFKNINVDGITGTVNARFCGLVGNLYGNMENVHVK